MSLGGIVLFLGNTLSEAGPLRDKARGGAPGEYETGTTPVPLNHGGRARFYLLHVPPKQDARKPSPLVFVIHGGGGSPGQIEKSARFNALADRDSVLLVYPAGSSEKFKDVFLTWNTGLTDTYADKEKIDDVGFLLAILKDVKTKFAIDPRRIYSTGMSQGGMMSYRLACEAADRFAAIGPV